MKTFVLLPGLDGSGEFFAEFARALAPLGRAVVVRYPPDRALGYTELVEYVLRDWPSGDDVIVIAESFSGPVALMLAARRSRGLRALALSATFARSPLPSLRMLRYAVLLGSPRWLPLRLSAALMLGRWSTPEWRRAIARALDGVSDAALRARGLAAFDVDARPLLADIDVPILYLRARHDRVVPARRGEEIVTAARDARLVEIDAPHFLLQIAPNEAVAAIDDFLQQRT